MSAVHVKSKTTDPISDLFTRIRNALLVSHQDTFVTYSKLKHQILEILKNEGFIRYIDIVRPEGLKYDVIKIGLKYTQDGNPVISTIRRISTPGKRVYIKKANIPKVLGGYGVAFISTSKGVLSGRAARLANVGGEFIGEVY